jgi:hypothetical protein
MCSNEFIHSNFMLSRNIKKRPIEVNINFGSLIILVSEVMITNRLHFSTKKCPYKKSALRQSWVFTKTSCINWYSFMWHVDVFFLHVIIHRIHKVLRSNYSYIPKSEIFILTRIFAEIIAIIANLSHPNYIHLPFSVSYLKPLSVSKLYGIALEDKWLKMNWKEIFLA